MLLPDGRVQGRRLRDRASLALGHAHRDRRPAREHGVLSTRTGGWSAGRRARRPVRARVRPAHELLDRPRPVPSRHADRDMYRHVNEDRRSWRSTIVPVRSRSRRSCCGTSRRTRSVGSRRPPCSWSPWLAISRRSAYRAQVLKLARLGAIEMKARPRTTAEGPEAGPQGGRDGSADGGRPGLHVVAVRSRRRHGRRDLDVARTRSRAGPPPSGDTRRGGRAESIERHHPPHPERDHGSSRPWQPSSRSARPATASGPRVGSRRRDRVVARSRSRRSRLIVAPSGSTRGSIEGLLRPARRHALAVLIWEHYLEWAVALDVADEVGEAGARARPGREACGRPIRGAPSGLAGVTAWHHFQTAAPTIVVASIASASSGSSSGGFGSSSSFSGFSGGGFSGGGGGGGGGTGGGAG